jgi:hypothetical protein
MPRAIACLSSRLDGISTSRMSPVGTCQHETCEFEGTNTDPMTGKAAPARRTSTHEADRETHAMYGPGPDGKEFKMMEMTYTRRR